MPLNNLFIVQNMGRLLRFERQGNPPMRYTCQVDISRSGGINEYRFVYISRKPPAA